MTLLVVLLVIAAVLAVLLFATANLLFDFALDPTSRFSMKRLLRSGKTKNLNSEVFDATRPQREEANRFFDAHATSVSITSDDGQELFGWMIEPTSQNTTEWALVCHGYTSQPREMSTYAKHFAEAGMGVMLPAARGHERNEGAGPIQMGWRDSQDLPRWVEAICARQPAAKIMLFGVSMGGAEVMMASGLDLGPQVRLIVEDCGYTCVWDEFRYQLKELFHLPAFPLLDLTASIVRRRAGFDLKEASSVSMLERATVPILFIHGDEDKFVPFPMMAECVAAYKGPLSQTLPIEGAGHGEAVLKDPNRYWSVVDAFLAEHLT